MSYFDILPLEIIEHIMSFMGLVQKEHFTRSYEKYYHIFKEEKLLHIERITSSSSISFFFSDYIKYHTEVP